LTEKHGFKPKARLLAQLGEQLIRNESVAIVELVKNAYDADASEVNVQINLEKDNKYLIIHDDGIGMSKDIFINNWLVPGTDQKLQDFENKKVSKKFGRLPIGEKGIGRFGVHKLGDHIEVLSKMKGKREAKLVIDWTELSKHDFLEDFQVQVSENQKTEHFKDNKTGTLIKISKLKGNWGKREVRNIIRSLNSLSSPFKKISKFKVNIEVSKPEYLEDLLTWNKIKDFAMFKFNIEIREDRIKKLKYEFIPYDELKKIQGRVITHNDPDVSKRLQLFTEGRSAHKIDLSKHNIGTIKINGYIFDRDNYTLSLSSMTDRKGFKDYLSNNTGIKVFRDDLRVYD
jgi:glycerophosphoryl diester phosphodiesterase